MKKTKLRLASVLLALGAMSLVGCGEGGGGQVVDPNGGNGGETPALTGKVSKTCKNCGETSEVDEKEKICPKCGKKINVCDPHTFGEYHQTKAPTALSDGIEEATCSKCGQSMTRPIPATGFEYNLTVKDANGTVVETRKIKSIEKFAKPADPTAPAGQVFYGWRNALNGGQIWNFDDDVLGVPKSDVELVPCFIPANINPQYIEAEFAPAITANGGMSGATYSGGAKGKGMIQEDSDYEYGAGCEIDAFDYYEDPSSFKPTVLTGELPAGAERLTKDPKGDKKGYFFHFNYIRGNELIFNIVSSADVTDAVIFGRFSAEYGIVSTETGDRTSSFSQDSFPITVNGTKLAYGNITMRNIPAVGDFLPFQDYLLSATVSLRAGNNVISMKVDNSDSCNGTLGSTSPCIDCLKVYTTASLSWPEAALGNILDE